MTTADFYDGYHQKNQIFTGVIGENNATYFYIQQTLHKACTLLSSGSWKQARVLDVGCGVGALSLYLASKGATVDGIDISPRAIKIAQQAGEQVSFSQRVSFRQAELQTAKRGRYDFVLCSEVIEHVPDDKVFYARLISQLKPGGVLMLTTPSKENLLYKLGYYQAFDQEVGHLRRYTRESLLSLAASQDVTISSLKEVEGPARNILFTSKLGLFVRFLKGPLVPAFHFFDDASAALFGSSDLQLLVVKN